MCGIAGVFARHVESGLSLDEAAHAMAESMVLRGPDEQATWVDAEAGVALAHARLAVVELSPAGHQPMPSHSGRFVIVYNGELYNTEELREQVVTPPTGWRGQSDTEVLLECCAQWGVTSTVKKAQGMFAFALWDRAERRLTLARDRLGIKPLYWTEIGGAFRFASELKALMAGGSRPPVDTQALASYFRFGYVPTPLSIFQGVRKLEAGSLLQYEVGQEPKVERYWDLQALAICGQREQLDLSDHEAVEHLDALLSDSVRRRLVGDVPIGAFLSGGIDSTVVVAAMQEHSATPVHTFTIGWNEAQYNEAQHAEAIAKHLGTKHTQLYVSPEDAIDIIPNLPQHYDEPFADSSQVPTCLVSKLARQHVTVALSGDGGDELFCGYNRYLWGESIWNRMSSVPHAVRETLAKSLGLLSSHQWDQLGRLLPSRIRPPHLGVKVHKVASVLPLTTQSALYRRLASISDAPEKFVRDRREWQNILWDQSIEDAVPDFQSRMQLLDALTYLPDDILAKVDRASMSVSLEARVPLLDHKIAEFAVRLPRHQKVRDGRGKWLLREVLSKRVPRKLFERPKMGFSIPIAEWLRGPLRPWAEALLSTQCLAAGNLLSPGPIRAAWSSHLSGEANHESELWAVLMFQAWREHWDV